MSEVGQAASRGYNAEVSGVLKEQKLSMKDELSGEYLGEATVWLKEMSESDVAHRTKMVLDQRLAQKKGKDDDVQFHAERIRQFDFVKSIEDWEGIMRPVRDDEGEIVWEKEPVYHTLPDGSVRRSRKSGIAMVKEVGIAEMEEMPLTPAGFRTLAQYVGDQIAEKIREINNLPDKPDELDEETGRKKPGSESSAKNGKAKTDAENYDSMMEEMEAFDEDEGPSNGRGSKAGKAN